MLTFAFQRSNSLSVSNNFLVQVFFLSHFKVQFSGTEESEVFFCSEYFLADGGIGFESASSVKLVSNEAEMVSSE